MDRSQIRVALTNLQKSLSINPVQLNIENRVRLIRKQLEEQINGTNRIAKDQTSRSYAQDLAPALNAGGSGPTFLEVACFLTGMETEAQFLEHANNSSRDLRIQNEQRCAAFYYAGMMRLHDGDRSVAFSYFRECVNSGCPGYGCEGYDEYMSAKTELKMLEH